MLKRQELEKLENRNLAAYAVKSSESQGREYPEEEHQHRSLFQRDRDRVIHCGAFRRLEYKTQVFVNHEGDYYRTRLTHTLEVSQIARSIASTLGLNVDLVEAISLAHDLGHTPFGHAGEETLNNLMKAEGGFEHNAQSLRVVEYLEERYLEFRGLNLTWEVREGLRKHEVDSPSLEAQLVDVADEIAYYSHDLDDGLRSKILSFDELSRIELWSRSSEKLIKGNDNAPTHLMRFSIIRNLMNILIYDILAHTEESIKKHNIKTLADVRNINTRLVSFSEKIDNQRRALREHLYAKMYHHPRVEEMFSRAQKCISRLFGAYIDDKSRLPKSFQERVGDIGINRVVCDYIAGMTDRYAREEYKNMGEK